jgi:hypothetical protein
VPSLDRDGTHQPTESKVWNFWRGDRSICDSCVSPDEQGLLYGMEPLIESIGRNRDRTAEEIRQAAIDDLRHYIGEQKVFDDITLVILKQK